jgi:hypothetical protein
MRDSELRGLILEALYNQRREDLVNLDQEVGGLPVPHSATESILRQLVKKGLVEHPIQSLNGLGNARITAYGIDVVQGFDPSVDSYLQTVLLGRFHAEGWPLFATQLC